MSEVLTDFVPVMKRAEAFANDMLFSFGLAELSQYYTERKWYQLFEDREKPKLIAQLYRNTAQATFRSQEESWMLHRLSNSVNTWLDLLRIVPSRDLKEVLEENSRLLTTWD